MCTIGTVFDGSAIHTFKQCDLIPVTAFEVATGRLEVSIEGHIIDGVRVLLLL